MDLELAGKVAWITGGSGGIGSAIARELGREGCRIAISGRDEERLRAAAAELGAFGVRADATDHAQVEQAAAAIADELGPVEILVNNAGAPGGRAQGPLEDVDDDLLLADLDAKYVGYLRTARAVVPSMKERGWGRLVHIGGLSARQSGSYSAGGRNIAIAHLSKTLSDELGPHGITSNVIHPSVTRTPWFAERMTREAAAQGISEEQAERRLADTHAIRRIVEATEVAYVVAFLASPKASSITGEVIAAGGGAQRGVTT